jgi:hemerythrin-like domain-containing protein
MVGDGSGRPKSSQASVKRDFVTADRCKDLSRALAALPRCEPASLWNVPCFIVYMDFSKLLTEEHKVIRRAMDILNMMTEQANHGMQVDIHDVHALLLFLHYFADASHQAKEEAILFPALDASEAFTSSKAQILLKDHNGERSLIEETQIALFTDRHSEFIASARRLTDLLSEHLIREESFLFPLAEQVLTQEEGMEISRRMQEADANFGYTQRKLLLDLLQQLADKYIRKAA